MATFSVTLQRAMQAPALKRHSRLVAVVGAVALSLGVVAACAGGELAGAALRCGLVLAGLGAAAAFAKKKAAASTDAPALSLASRQALAKESGVAIVVADGRRLLVGYGPSGVALLTSLEKPE